MRKRRAGKPQSALLLWMSVVFAVAAFHNLHQCCSQLMELPRVPSKPPISGIKAIAMVAHGCFLGTQQLCSHVPERNTIPPTHIWNQSCHCSEPHPWVPGLGSEPSLTEPHCHCCEPQFFPRQGLWWFMARKCCLCSKLNFTVNNYWPTNRKTQKRIHSWRLTRRSRLNHEKIEIYPMFLG